MVRQSNKYSILIVLLMVMGMVLAACGAQDAQSTAVSGATAVSDDVNAAATEVAPGVNTAVTAGQTAVAEPTAVAPIDTDVTAVATGTTGAGAAAPCPDKAGEEALIYSSLPMTGGSAAQIQTVIEGMQLALEQQGGKAGGFTVKYEPLDDATAAKGSWDEGQETENANKAIQDKASVYLGTFNSGAAAVSIPILNEAGIPMISPANTAINLTLPGNPEPKLFESLYQNGPRNYFRVVPNDALQGAALANYAKELGVTKVYILHDQQTYGLGLASVFRDRAKELGIEVAGFEGIDPKAGSYSGVAQKVISSDSNALFFGGLDATGGPQLLKDLRSIQPDPEAVKFMGGDGINSTDFAKGVGAEGEGTYATVATANPANYEGRAKEFYDSYKAKYNKEPDPYAIFGYDSMGVALEAINRACSNDPKAILEQLNQLGQYDGALGNFTFDKNGDTTLTKYYGWILKGDKYTFDREVSTVIEK